MLGQTISHYRILQKLGAGGMGDVYLALDESLERRVALKFLKGEFLEDTNYRRILAEARAVAAVDHPFVCKVYEAAENNGQPFIAFEFVSGTTFEARLKEGPLSANQAIKFACELAEALTEVHARALVHLDIKPANIMLTRYGHVKLMDFGLARQALNWTPPDESIDRSNLPPLPGTPEYMAPEQIRGEAVDARADIFALGITLHEMFTGSHPFLKETTKATVVAILNESYSPIVSDTLPPALADIIARALRKNPDQRYSTAEELRLDLAASNVPGSEPQIAASAGIHIEEQRPDTTPEAYDLYLRGRQCWKQRTPVSLLQSLEYYQMASEADAKLVQAFSGLALSYVTLAIYGSMRPGEAMPLARHAAKRALALDRTNADALAALGCIASICDWKWDAAEDYFKEALAADPMNALARHWYAINLLAPLGRFDEAAVQMDHAAHLDRQSPLFLATTGLRYYFERRYSQALDYLNKALRLDPVLPITHYFLGHVCLARNEFSKAADHARKAVMFSAEDSESLALLACSYAREDTEAAVKILEDLRSRVKTVYVSPVLFSQVYCCLGDQDRALAMLEEAFTWRAADLIWIRVKPIFDSLRRDVRFIDLCKRIGFPAEL